MSEISEKTRLGVTIGGAALLVVIVFGAGQFWGGRAAKDDFRDLTLARHDTEISELRKSIAEIKETIVRSEASQRAALDASNRADGKGTAILLEMATLRETLASRGINIQRPNKGDD